MSPTAAIQAFAQSVYMIIKNRYLDDITNSDGQAWLAQIVDHLNQYLDELETETDDQGNLVQWPWMRTNDFTLGTATYTAGATGPNVLPLPAGVTDLIASDDRFVLITDSKGNVPSYWNPVNASEQGNMPYESHDDTVAVIGGQLVFSRQFSQNEDGATITGDILQAIPRVTTSKQNNLIVATNVKALSTVVPKQLLILGVAKNAVLPDIVKGGLTPSFVQKYNSLYAAAIQRAMASATSPTVKRDNFSHIGGVGI